MFEYSRNNSRRGAGKFSPNCIMNACQIGKRQNQTPSSNPLWPKYLGELHIYLYRASNAAACHIWPYWMGDFSRSHAVSSRGHSCVARGIGSSGGPSSPAPAPASTRHRSIDYAGWNCRFSIWQFVGFFMADLINPTGCAGVRRCDIGSSQN